MEHLGEFAQKSRAKRAMRDVFEEHKWETETELIHRTSVRIASTLGQMGQLIPDIAAYVPPHSAGPHHQADYHGDIVVEIDWLHDAERALQKVPHYFAPGFIGPNRSVVKEVWSVFLSRDAPALPDALIHSGPVAPLQPFLGLLSGTAERTEPAEPTMIVYHSRDNVAFPPCMSFVHWNITVPTPPGSLFAGGFDANPVLRRMYRGKSVAHPCFIAFDFPVPCFLCPHVADSVSCFPGDAL